MFKNIQVIKDPHAKTLSYSCTTDFVRVDEQLIQGLIDVSIENGECNARLNLHTTPAANFHEMLILQHKGSYYRPHKHLTKGESWLVLKGKAAAFIFNDGGDIIGHSILGEGGDLMSRIGPGMWHAIMPFTKYVIYLEAKPGPFVAGKDSIFPSWAPNGADMTEAEDYSERLLTYVDKESAAAGNSRGHLRVYKNGSI